MPYQKLNFLKIVFIEEEVSLDSVSAFEISIVLDLSGILTKTMITVWVWSLGVVFGCGFIF